MDEMEEKRTEMLNWLKELESYARGRKWNTGGIWVCESHSLMPHEQGLSFDCRCGGGVGMPPVRYEHVRPIWNFTGKIAKNSRISLQEECCPVCESPLEENGVCSDVGNNNCQYLK